MNEKYDFSHKAMYIARIVLGIFLLGAGVIASFVLHYARPSDEFLYAGISVLILALMGLTLFIRQVYRKMDELHRALHQQACVAALSLLLAASGVIGVLQANGLVPEFNQFWSMGGIIVIWSINLMLADRSYL